MPCLSFLEVAFCSTVVIGCHMGTSVNFYVYDFGNAIHVTIIVHPYKEKHLFVALSISMSHCIRFHSTRYTCFWNTFDHVWTPFLPALYMSARVNRPPHCPMVKTLKLAIYLFLEFRIQIWFQKYHFSPNATQFLIKKHKNRGRF
jgi:hypothetical protein